MKAIVCSRYGSPDFMEVRDVPKPVPRANEVLVRIHAATVTAGDCEIRNFNIPALFWLPLRLFLGLNKPNPGIFGQEFSGEVEMCDGKVTKFKPGDTVFGPTTIRLGSYAQFICIPESYLAKFSLDKLTYDEAATIPTGGLNGLHFVEKAQIKPGDSVLIVGAGGSIGTYALQFAGSLCAEITCVDTGDKLDMLKRLGATDIIDYKEDDFTRNGRTYDVIIDIAGKASFPRLVKCLNQNGRLVLGNPTISSMFKAMWISMATDKNIMFQMASYRTENLNLIKDMIEAGKIKPVIDKRFPLEDLGKAHRYVETGLKAGNVVVQISHQ